MVYLSTFLLTLSNPLTILSFIAIFAGIGASIGSSGNILSPLLVVVGVFSGSLSWWLLLTSAISLLRRNFNTLWLQWINRISGAILLLFGVLAVLSLR